MNWENERCVNENRNLFCINIWIKTIFIAFVSTFFFIRWNPARRRWCVHGDCSRIYFEYLFSETKREMETATFGSSQFVVIHLKKYICCRPCSVASICVCSLSLCALCITVHLLSLYNITVGMDFVAALSSLLPCILFMFNEEQRSCTSSNKHRSDDASVPAHKCEKILFLKFFHFFKKLMVSEVYQMQECVRDWVIFTCSGHETETKTTCRKRGREKL